MSHVEDIERELEQIKLERDALARHVEALVAPLTWDEVRAFKERAEVVGASFALGGFFVARKRVAQFAAFNGPVEITQ